MSTGSFVAAISSDGTSFLFLQDNPTLGLSIFDSRVGVVLLRAETETGATHMEDEGEFPLVGQTFVGYICNPVLQMFHMSEVPVLISLVFSN